MHSQLRPRSLYVAPTFPRRAESVRAGIRERKVRRSLSDRSRTAYARKTTLQRKQDRALKEALCLR